MKNKPLVIVGSILGGAVLIGAIGTATNNATDDTALVGAATAPAPTVTDELAAATPTTPPKPAGPATSFGTGTYVVGTDIEPGTYRTTGPADSDMPICYWAREKDTSGEFASIIANGSPQGPAVVTISASDGAFETSDCVTWTLVK